MRHPQALLRPHLLPRKQLLRPLPEKIEFKLIKDKENIPRRCLPP